MLAPELRIAYLTHSLDEIRRLKWVNMIYDDDITPNTEDFVRLTPDGVLVYNPFFAQYMSEAFIDPPARPMTLKELKEQPWVDPDQFNYLFKLCSYWYHNKLKKAGISPVDYMYRCIGREEEKRVALQAVALEKELNKAAFLQGTLWYGTIVTVFLYLVFLIFQ